MSCGLLHLLLYFECPISICGVMFFREPIDDHFTVLDLTCWLQDGRNYEYIFREVVVHTTHVAVNEPRGGQVQAQDALKTLRRISYRLYELEIARSLALCRERYSRSRILCSFGIIEDYLAVLDLGYQLQDRPGQSLSRKIAVRAAYLNQGKERGSTVQDHDALQAWNQGTCRLCALRNARALALNRVRCEAECPCSRQGGVSMCSLKRKMEQSIKDSDALAPATAEEPSKKVRRGPARTAGGHVGRVSCRLLDLLLCVECAVMGLGSTFSMRRSPSMCPAARQAEQIPQRDRR